MKTILLLIGLVLGTGTSVMGQTTNALPGAILPGSIRALPIAKPTITQTPSRESLTNSIFAGHGLNASRPVEMKIEPAPFGARTEFGLQKTFFPTDVKDAPVVITTPDGRKLSFRATFIALHDKQSGQSLLLAELTNRTGAIVADDEVLYEKSFDTLDASVRYRILANGNGLEQDVLLDEFLPELPDGFTETSSQIQLWTEWFDSEPVSRATQAIDLRAHEPSGLLPAAVAEDEGLDFGTMKIVTGYAFSSTAEAGRAPVAKSWVRIDGRDWLIETVDYLAVKSKLDLLPKRRRTASLDRRSDTREKLIRSLAQKGTPQPANQPRMLMAQATPAKRPQFVMDFVIVSTVPTPSGIISWWPAPTGTNAYDAVTNNHATLQNGATNAVGKVGQGFSLDGSNDRISAPDSATLDFGALADFSIEAWIKPQTNTADFGVTAVISKRYSPDASTTLGYELFLLDGKLALRLDDPSNKYYFPTTNLTPNLRDGSFHHVAVTVARDSNTGLNFYIDGNLIETFDPTVSPGDLSNSEPLRIGNHPTPSLNCFFKGVIDEPAIYNRVLGESEILAIYNAGAAGKHNPNCVAAPTNIVAWWPGDGNSYDLARTNHATVSGATYVSAVVGQGFSFNGYSAGVTAAADNALNLITTNDQVSIEAWVNPQANGTTYDVMSVVGKRYTPDSYTTIGYEMFLLGGKPGFQIMNLSGVYSFWATNDLRDGGYHHVVATLDRTLTNGGKIYIDGAPRYTFNPTVLSGSLSNSEPVRIGVHPQPGFNGWYKGIIDEPTIYRRALTNTEVAALYAAGSAGKCKVDSDGDGLTDSQEGFLGTAVNDSDSDDDGLSDGDEVFVHHTNVHSSDTDGDELSDSWEVGHGTNPLTANAAVRFVAEPKATSNIP